MDNLHIYGNVLYNSMRYIKGIKITPKLRKKLVTYTDLWNFCLILLYDEITFGSNNIGKLKEYIDLNKEEFSKFFDAESCCENTETDRKIPIKAISMISQYVSKINIGIINYKENCEDIQKNLIALHNLPRCLLKPSSKGYICENDAVEYSRSGN